MNKAHYAVRDGVAVLTPDNPPANGLRLEPRQAIFAVIERGHDDFSVAAINVIGVRTGSSVGANIFKFCTPKAAAGEPPYCSRWSDERT
jgi:enoyl-CoA hydratase/carnithine racemase